jgi:hypothetical protein
MGNENHFDAHNSLTCFWHCEHLTPTNPQTFNINKWSVMYDPQAGWLYLLAISRIITYGHDCEE